MKCVLLLGLALLSPAGQESAPRSDPQSRRAPEQRIFVHGAARKPGRLARPAEYTLLELVSDAAQDADLSEVLVVRQGKTDPIALEIDVRHMLVTGDTTWNVVLRDGDLVLFRKDRARRAVDAPVKDADHPRPGSRAAR